MDIAGETKAVIVAGDDLRGVASLKAVSWSFCAVAEIQAVRGVEALHEAAEVGVGSFNKEVIMVGHEGEGV